MMLVVFLFMNVVMTLSCSICTKKWHKKFLPVYQSSVIAFLRKLPPDVDYKETILSLLAGSAFWKETIFNWAPGGISQMQVGALFLSFIACIVIQLQPNNKTLQWSITREYATTANNCFIEAHIGSPPNLLT